MTDEEMTRLIADKLMGWKEFGGAVGYPEPGVVVLVPSCFHYTDMIVFNPLISDKDAMMVFDKMAERDHISLYVTNYGKMWVCETGRCTDKMHIYSKQPFTPEGRRRVICEAAVQMVQGEHKQVGRGS